MSVVGMILVVLVGLSRVGVLNMQPPQEQSLVDLETSIPQTGTPLLASTADFDYFVLALSWSPTYCATDGADDSQQCSPGKRYGFVLHGLWPQYEQGFPSNCSTEKFPSELQDQFAGLYPNDKLFTHAWEKHGTCSGLSPIEYMTLAQQLKQAVRIPEAYQAPLQPFRTTSQQMEQAFVQANPGFNALAFAIYCTGDGRFLKEMFVCFDLTGKPRACSQEVQRKAMRSCRNPNFLVRNVR